MSKLTLEEIYAFEEKLIEQNKNRKKGEAKLFAGYSNSGVTTGHSETIKDEKYFLKVKKWYEQIKKQGSMTEKDFEKAIEKLKKECNIKD